MPLSRIQREALRLLAAQRNPESYVAGAAPINREGPRYSADIDIFHDREESVAAAADADAEILRRAGFALESHTERAGPHQEHDHAQRPATWTGQVPAPGPAPDLLQVVGVGPEPGAAVGAVHARVVGPLPVRGRDDAGARDRHRIRT